MCQEKKNVLKIFYLNVNGFFGDSSIKGALYGNAPKHARNIIKACRNDQLNILFADKIYDEIFCVEDNDEICVKDYDLIFLSEIDTRSDATKNFVNRITAGGEYKVLTPDPGKNLVNLDFTTCTLCFSKEEIVTNIENGFTDDDYLQFCKVKKDDLTIMGIHWGSNKKDRQESLLRLIEKDAPILLFGDTNSNPETEPEVESFGEMVDKQEWTEIYPPKSNKEYPNTYRGITRIDRVFTRNLPPEKVSVEVLEKFWKKGLSDHAALSITVTW